MRHYRLVAFMLFAAAACTSLPPPDLAQPKQSPQPELTFAGTREDAAKLAVESLEAVGLSVNTVDAGAGFVGATNGLNERSWGERVGVYFREQGDGAIRMWVVSMRKTVTNNDVPDWSEPVTEELKRRIAEHPGTAEHYARLAAIRGLSARTTSPSLQESVRSAMPARMQERMFPEDDAGNREQDRPSLREGGDPEQAGGLEPASASEPARNDPQPEPEPEAEEVAQAFGAAVAEPDPVAAEITGTCFAADPEGLVLTSHRAVAGATSIRVHFTDGRSAEAKLERYVPGIDVALLRLAEPTPRFLSLSNQQRVTVGQAVFTLSFASATELGSEPTFAYGNIRTLSGPLGDRSLFESSVPLDPNRSGGPVVNERAEVVGIVTPVPAPLRVLQARGDLDPDNSWAVSAEYAKGLFPGERAQLPPAKDRWEAIDRVRAALCQVEAAFR